MSELAAYFYMDGYAMFVWPAYSLALLGLVGVLWASMSAWKARESEFEELKTSHHSNEHAGQQS